MNPCGKHYYSDIARWVRFGVPAGQSVLEIGCKHTGYLEAARPERAVAVTLDDAGKQSLQRPDAPWLVQTLAEFKATKHEPFGVIILSDVLGKVPDVQTFLESLQAAATPRTRVLVTNYSRLWQPMLKMAEWLGCKTREPEENWLGRDDLANMLNLSGYEVVDSGQRMLLPVYIPLVSFFLNRILVKLPVLRHFCLYNAMVARPLQKRGDNPSLSVLVPARNESGNIEAAVKRMPRLGRFTEIIFVEGGSSDDTWAEIQRVQEKYKDQWPIQIAQQPGKGKGDAVRTGFALATGDILTILDADLTMPPEELPKFYNAVASGQAEFANGCRLVYPQEKEAMRFCNIIGNHFFSLAFSWLLGQRLKDTLCGTKMLYRDDYERLAANRSYFGDFDPFGDFDLIFGAARMNLKIMDIPIHYKARVYGDTNISRWRHGLILLKMTLFAFFKIKLV